MSLIAVFTAILLTAICPSLATGTCGGLQGDVVFLLDASGSVGSANFQTMLQFVQDLVSDFDIGPSLVRVAVIRYATYVSTIFHLDAYTTASSVNSAVASIPYTGGLTNTGDAIDTMRTTFNFGVNGDRTGIPNVGIVITDGLSKSPSLTSTAAASARAAGFTIFSIGIGIGVTELNKIASDPDSDHVFTVANFNGLSSIESAFQGKACSSGSYIGSPPANIPAPTSGSPPANTPAPNSDETSVDIAPVVGAVIGAVVVIAVVVVVVVVVKLVITSTAPVAPVISTTTASFPPTVIQTNQIPHNLTAAPSWGNVPPNVQPVDTRLMPGLPPQQP